MASTATRITADEYFARTTVGDRTQLVDGELVVNEPKLIHAALQGRLYIALANWVGGGGDRGFVSLPTDVRVDDHNVFGPDLVWFAAGHVPANLDGYPDRIPDLCVEVRSQSTWRYDIGAKKRAYETGGLAELWLVDDRSDTVLVYRRSDPDAIGFDVALELADGDELTSPQLPSFSLAIGALFERP